MSWTIYSVHGCRLSNSFNLHILMAQECEFKVTDQRTWVA